MVTDVDGIASLVLRSFNKSFSRSSKKAALTASYVSYDLSPTDTYWLENELKHHLCHTTCHPRIHTG